MPFQDLLKKQINNLGKELNEVLQRVLPLNDPDLVSMFVDKEADKHIEPQLHVKLNELVRQSPEQLRQLFNGKDSEQMENLELLTDVFAALGKKEAYELADEYRLKAIDLYQYITDQTATFSFARSAKIAALTK